MAYGYDAAGRLTHVQHSTRQETLTGLTYTLDAEGNRVAVHETTIRLQSYYFPALGRPEVLGAQALAMGATSLPESEETISYTYDAADRLTGGAYTSGDSYGYAYRCDGLSSGTGWCGWA